MKAVLALFLLLAAPAVSADLRIIGIDGAPSQPAPAGQPFNVTVQLEADCQTVLISGGLQDTATATLSWRAPPDALAIAGPTVVHLPFSQCLDTDGAVRVAVPAQLTVLDAAPGLVPVVANLSAAMGSPPPGLPPNPPASTQLTITPAANFILELATAQKVRLTRDGVAAFTVTVTNFGNLDTKVVIEQVEGSSKLQAVEPVLVSRRGEAASSAEVVLKFGSPKGPESQVTLRFAPESASDAGVQGQAVTLTLLVRESDSFLRELPAPPLLPLLLVALALAAVRRRA